MTAEPQLDNMFALATTEGQVLAQMVSAGSTCWETLAGAGTFDDTFASKVVDHGEARLKEIRGAALAESLSKAVPTFTQMNVLADRMDATKRANHGLRKYLLFGPRHHLGGTVAIAGRTFFWGTHRSERADGKRWAVTWR